MRRELGNKSDSYKLLLFCKTSFGRELILVGEVQDGGPMSFLLIQQSENTGDLIFLYFFYRQYFCTLIKEGQLPNQCKIPPED